MLRDLISYRVCKEVQGSYRVAAADFCGDGKPAPEARVAAGALGRPRGTDEKTRTGPGRGRRVDKRRRARGGRGASGRPVEDAREGYPRATLEVTTGATLDLP